MGHMWLVHTTVKTWKRVERPHKVFEEEAFDENCNKMRRQNTFCILATVTFSFKVF